jgi:hypothetical protein
MCFQVLSEDIGSDIDTDRERHFQEGIVPPLRDGHATERIVEVLERVL